MMNHHQASVIMNVSRPTLTRIYARARQKIAEAMVKGWRIIIEGGKIYFDSDWFECSSCSCFFNNPDKQQEITGCPLCGSKDVSVVEQDPEETGETAARCSDICICRGCGYEQPHGFGRPCRDEVCPKCGSGMMRKGTQNRRKTKGK
jgi:rRNA maturation endonuclease Nob1